MERNRFQIPACGSDVNPPEDTTCYPVNGAITVFYRSAVVNTRQVNALVVDMEINDIITQIMDDGSLASDAVPKVNYIGIRGDTTSMKFSADVPYDPWQYFKENQLSLAWIVGTTVVAIIAVAVYSRIETKFVEDLPVVVEDLSPDQIGGYRESRRQRRIRREREIVEGQRDNRDDEAGSYLGRVVSEWFGIDHFVPTINGEKSTRKGIESEEKKHSRSNGRENRVGRGTDDNEDDDSDCSSIVPKWAGLNKFLPRRNDENNMQGIESEERAYSGTNGRKNRAGKETDDSDDDDSDCSSIVPKWTGLNNFLPQRKKYNDESDGRESGKFDEDADFCAGAASAGGGTIDIKLTGFDNISSPAGDDEDSDCSSIVPKWTGLDKFLPPRKRQMRIQKIESEEIEHPIGIGAVDTGGDDCTGDLNAGASGSVGNYNHDAGNADSADCGHEDKWGDDFVEDDNIEFPSVLT